MQLLSCANLFAIIFFEIKYKAVLVIVGAVFTNLFHNSIIISKFCFVVIAKTVKQSKTKHAVRLLTAFAMKSDSFELCDEQEFSALNLIGCINLGFSISLSYETLNRHYYQTAVSGSLFSYVILCYQPVSPSSLKNFPVTPSLSSVAYLTITVAASSTFLYPL